MNIIISYNVDNSFRNSKQNGLTWNVCAFSLSFNINECISVSSKSTTSEYLYLEAFISGKNGYESDNSKWIVPLIGSWSNECLNTVFNSWNNIWFEIREDILAIHFSFSNIYSNGLKHIPNSKSSWIAFCIYIFKLLLHLLIDVESICNL